MSLHRAARSPLRPRSGARALVCTALVLALAGLPLTGTATADDPVPGPPTTGAAPADDPAGLPLTGEATADDPVPGTDVPVPGGDAPVPGAGDASGGGQTQQQRVTEVVAVEQRLAAAQAAQQDLDIQAEQAVERYDGATVREQIALEAARTAAATAAAAVAGRQAAHIAAGAVAAAQYRSGVPAGLVGFDRVLQARDAEAADSAHEVQRAVDGQARMAVDTATGTAARATAAATAAARAAAAAKLAATAVQLARQQVQTRLAAQRTQVTALQSQQSQLLVQLADAEGTTVGLAAQHEQDLAAATDEQAAEAARQSALDAPAPTPDPGTDPGTDPAAAPDPAADLATDPATDPASAADPSADPAADPPADPATDAAADPQSDPLTDPDAASAPATAPAAAPPDPAAAVRYARAQLGLPYVWGAAGPGTFDCSGLTMRAWQRAGVPLPHFAADQYARSRPIRYSQLRPGDLVFWSHDGTPQDIYHVALYIGGDRMIEAPRTGDVVKVASLWAMGTPSFYARP